jgi:carbon-monoxide dehydrogenase medium subunit/xanthine dehydrogenase FAD-binding subunit
MSSKFNYVRPNSLTEAIALLNDPAHTSRVLAGGTDVLVYLHHEKPTYDRVVDISLLSELKVIRREEEVVILGAGVTFTEVIESQILQEATPFLVEACRAVGGPQIRNRGAIGGNVVNAAACADSLPPLVCLDAAAHLRGPDGERVLPVSALVLRPNQTQLQPGEILTHFTFAAPLPGVQTAFIKVGRRNAQAISRLTMAAMGRLDAGGLVDFVRLTPGAATPQTIRFTQAEDMLLGQRPTTDLIAAAGRQVAETMIAITGRRWSTAYKEPVIAVLAERALRRVLGE